MNSHNLINKNLLVLTQLFFSKNYTAGKYDMPVVRNKSIQTLKMREIHSKEIT